MIKINTRLYGLNLYQSIDAQRAGNLFFWIYKTNTSLISVNNSFIFVACRYWWEKDKNRRHRFPNYKRIRTPKAHRLPPTTSVRKFDEIGGGRYTAHFSPNEYGFRYSINTSTATCT